VCVCVRVCVCVCVYILCVCVCVRVLHVALLAFYLFKFNKIGNLSLK